MVSLARIGRWRGLPLALLGPIVVYQLSLACLSVALGFLRDLGGGLMSQVQGLSVLVHATIFFLALHGLRRAQARLVLLRRQSALAALIVMAVTLGLALPVEIQATRLGFRPWSPLLPIGAWGVPWPIAVAHACAAFALAWLVARRTRAFGISLSDLGSKFLDHASSDDHFSFRFFRSKHRA